MKTTSCLIVNSYFPCDPRNHGREDPELLETINCIKSVLSKKLEVIRWNHIMGLSFGGRLIGGADRGGAVRLHWLDPVVVRPTARLSCLQTAETHWANLGCLWAPCPTVPCHPIKATPSSALAPRPSKRGPTYGATLSPAPVR